MKAEMTRESVTDVSYDPGEWEGLILRLDLKKMELSMANKDDRLTLYKMVVAAGAQAIQNPNPLTLRINKAKDMTGGRG